MDVASKRREPSARAIADQALTDRIAEIHTQACRSADSAGDRATTADSDSARCARRENPSG
jgi:hypothetical protein